MGKNNEINEIVEMSHVLNQMRDGYSTLAEQRLLYIYLGKINSRNPETINIKLSLDEFCKICDLQPIKDPKIYEPITKSLMQKIVTLPKKYGYRQFPLFCACELSKDEETGEYYFTFGANPYYLDVFFNLQRYVKFRLQNALKLKSLNQMRMYTLLKQYLKIRKYKMSLQELREYLNIKSEEYPQYFSFRQNVLEICQKEINALTDIEFDYVGIRGRGRGGKIVSIEFIIRENLKVKDKEPDIIDNWTADDCVSVLPMNELTPKPPVAPTSANPSPYQPTVSYIKPPKIDFDGYNLILTGEPYFYVNEENEYYACICDNIFSEQEISDLIGIIEEYTPRRLDDDYQHVLGTVLSREYKLLIAEVSRRHGSSNQIKDYYKYFRRILERKLSDFEKEVREKEKEYAVNY